MVRGKDDILRWFENSGMPYWRIYPHKGVQSGNMTMQSNQDEGRSAGDALEELKFKIRTLDRGTFTLVAFPTADRLPSKGYFHTEIEITADQKHSVNGVSSISEADISRRIAEGITSALNAYKAEQELVELKKKVIELEKEKKQFEKSQADPWNKVIAAIAPYSEHIVGSLFPQAKAVAGLPAPDAGPQENNIQETSMENTIDETMELSSEQMEVINSFLNSLTAADPEWLITLQRLTKAIEEKPSMIAMVKNFI